MTGEKLLHLLCYEDDINLIDLMANNLTHNSIILLGYNERRFGNAKQSLTQGNESIQCK